VNEVNNLQVETVSFDIFSGLYNEYYPKIYKYTLYRVGDHDTAEDLVSEVFEKVLVKYYSYNPEKGKFSTWLFAIANHTIINYHNKNNRHSEFVDIEIMESNYQLEDLIIERESKELLLQALICLNERQRNVIALKFGAYMNNREIARMLNLTESNVGTILYRSLKQLRDILKAQGAVYSTNCDLGCEND